MVAPAGCSQVRALIANSLHQSNEPFYPVRVPHLDCILAGDFLAFPFYNAGEEGEEVLVEPDENHKTFWVEESWSPLVFAHTAYYHCDSFYRELVEFLGK